MDTEALNMDAVTRFLSTVCVYGVMLPLKICLSLTPLHKGSDTPTIVGHTVIKHNFSPMFSIFVILHCLIKQKSVLNSLNVMVNE